MQMVGTMETRVEVQSGEMIVLWGETTDLSREMVELNR